MTKGVAYPVWSRNGGTSIMAKNLTGNDQRFTQLINRELRIHYPPSFLGRHLRTVVVCKDLTHGGESVGGVSVTSLQAIYLNMIQEELDQASEVLFVQALHHEIAHMFVPSINEWFFRDWRALNSNTFTYRNERDPGLEDAAGDTAESPTGAFVNDYSTTGIREDFCEVYALLMSRHLATFDDNRVGPALSKKIEMVKALLDEWGLMY